MLDALDRQTGPPRAIAQAQSGFEIGASVRIHRKHGAPLNGQATVENTQNPLLLAEFSLEKAIVFGSPPHLEKLLNHHRPSPDREGAQNEDNHLGLGRGFVPDEAEVGATLSGGENPE